MLLPLKDLVLALESYIYVHKTAVKEAEAAATLFHCRRRDKGAKGLSELSDITPFPLKQ